MAHRHLPVRPDLEQLRHQAKDLLRAILSGNPNARRELGEHHPSPPEPDAAKLADAQLALARSYGVPSWPRLVHACRLIDAIWQDDVEAVRGLVARHPNLLRENARGTEKCNWGPPMAYAANLGRDRVIAALHELGATDLEHALDRAVLQGKVDTARLLTRLGAPTLTALVMGPAETLNGAGMAYALEECGAPLHDEHGDRLAPVALVLETYVRNPAGKHRCLELFAEHGVELPDTPPMAVHRGRIDLLEAHLRRDPDLLARTFAHEEIWPPELGCHDDPTLALHGTPLAGGTLLHLCVDYDEIAIARWLIANGADPNARAVVDADGFGGHTPLFGTVVSYAFNLRVRLDDGFARLLLDSGADPNARASLRKRLRFVGDGTEHAYHDVTSLAWGERFHEQAFVSHPAMKLIAERGGGM